MNSYEKEIVEQDLDYLCENTTGDDQILIKLRAKKFMTEAEVEAIKSKKVRSVRNYEIYTHVMKKEGAMNPLLEILRDTKNHAIADRLDKLLKAKQIELNNEATGSSEGIKGSTQGPSNFNAKVEGNRNKTAYNNISRDTFKVTGKEDVVVDKSSDSSNQPPRDKRVNINVKGDDNTTSGGDITERHVHYK